MSKGGLDSRILMSGCESEPVARDDKEVSEWLGLDRSDEGVRKRACSASL
jgi:hypothetical protein